MPKAAVPGESVATHAHALGYAGALPVWLLAVGPLVDPRLADYASFAVVYVAAIFAFLGGIQWGFACAHPAAHGIRRLYASVVPPLISAIALLLAPLAGALVLVLGIAAYLVYEWIEQAGMYPGWYLRLRLRLSVLLSAGMLLAVGVSA